MIEATATRAKPNWIKRILIGIGLIFFLFVLLLVRQAFVMNEKISKMNDEIARSDAKTIAAFVRLKTLLRDDVAIPATINTKEVAHTSDRLTMCGLASVEKRGGAYVRYRKFYMRQLGNGQREVEVAPLPYRGQAAREKFDEMYKSACQYTRPV